MNSALLRGKHLLFQSCTLKRLLFGTFLVGSLYCCASISGCQKNLLQNAPQANLPTEKKLSKPQKIPQELDGLHVYLSQDLWIRNHKWSAEQEWKSLRHQSPEKATPSIDVHRWVYGSLKQKALIAESVEPKQPVAEISDPEKAGTNVENQKTQPTAEPVIEKEAPLTENWSFNTLKDFLMGNGLLGQKSDSEQSRGKFAALKLLSKQDSLAGWNATILWATLDPTTAQETIPQLEKIAFENLTYDSTQYQNKSKSHSQNLVPSQIVDKKQRKPERVPLSSAMQHAAINGICLTLSNADAIPLETKNRLTQLLQRPDISIDLRGELYRGLARIIPPAEIPSLEQTLDVSNNANLPPKTLRRAAMDACLIHGLFYYADQNLFAASARSEKQQREFESSVWPTNMMQVRWDSDEQIRWKFGFWTVLVQHPDRESILTSQLRDADLTVQNKAIEHLGLVGTKTALDLLIAQTKRSQESSRVSATVGLTAWGTEHLAPLINDSSAKVRKAAAKGLGKTPTPEAALLLQSLISDRNTDVQLAVIESISHWPDELAIPLMIEGIQEGAYKTRRKNILQLMQRTGLGGSISIEASRAERIAAIQKLIQAKQLPGGLSDQLLKHGLQEPHKNNSSRIAAIQAHFHDVIKQPYGSIPYRHAYQELSNISAKEVVLLEKIILDTTVEVPNEIYTDLLPKLNPNYEALNQLSSSQLTDRRKAAQQLFLNSQRVSLSPVIVKRLRTIMTHEQDRLVWRIIMESIAKDNYEETAQLALLAINNNWPDIRVLGCQHFGLHGSPQYVSWLLPLLNDKNISVQLAAINALGQCHNPIAIAGIQHGSQNQENEPSLRALLTHSNQRIRFHTVVALSRLGDIEGMRELVRFSNDPLSSTRFDAIKEMGSSGQTRFVEPLIQLAWTERNHTTLKEILRSLEKLVPISEQPKELASSKNHSDKAQIWMDWWQSQNSGSSTRLFTGR